MTPARPIPAKVQRLIPVLGSPVDGEAIAAVRAVGRALQRDDLDYHDLAAAIPTRPDCLDDQICTSRPSSRSPAAADPEFCVYRRRRAYTPRQEAQHRARAAYCQSQRGRLTPWERAFVDDVSRLRGNLSVRQGDQLALLVERLEWEARRA